MHRSILLQEHQSQNFTVWPLLFSITPTDHCHSNARLCQLTTIPSPYYCTVTLHVRSMCKRRLYKKRQIFHTKFPHVTVPNSKAQLCGHSPADILGSNPTGGMEVCLLWVSCVLSGRGLRDQLITRSEESYWLWCVVVCDLETSRMGAPYIYDTNSLKVNDLTLILLTWRKWWAPNNASK